jgi:L-iditol 2-dehydrogenase
MDQRMKALLLSRYKHLEIVDLPEPVPGPGEVLVRVAACGICGSDIHGYDGSTGRRIPPIVMGHEAAGTVCAWGEGVTGFANDDRVTFDSTVYCGSCTPCLRGEVNLCEHRQVLGVSCTDYHRPGAFAEYVAVTSHAVHRLPDNLSFEEAAMLEPLSVALHAVSLRPVQAGDTALVVGAGMIGLLLVQVLSTAGCSRIFVADLDQSRLDLARTVGATDVIAASTDPAEAVLQHTGGTGVDVTMEAVGRTETVQAAIASVRKGGTVVLVGNVAPEVALPLQKVVTRQIRLQGSCASAGEYPRAIELLASGALQVRPLITAVAPLDHGPRWFARLYAREPHLMKVILTPGESA